jgi:hypothetical protein
MSRGLGWTQRAVLALIEEEPDGAWPSDELCALLYHRNQTEKKHRVAVLRALQRMRLPGTWQVWRLSRHGGAYCLVDPCSDESMARLHYAERSYRAASLDFADWKRREPEDFERARAQAEESRRYRDASPIDKLTIDIAEAEKRAAMWATVAREGPGAAASFQAALKRVEALKAEKAAKEQEAISRRPENGSVS